MATETQNQRNTATDGAIIASVTARDAFTNAVENIGLNNFTQKIQGFFAELMQSLTQIFGRVAGNGEAGAAAERTTNLDDATNDATVTPASYTQPSGNRTYEGDSIARQLGVGSNNNGINGLRLAQAKTPEFSRGDTVVTSFGTNDAGFLIGASNARIEAWAKQYGDYLSSIQANGGNPVALDIRHATGVYTGNMGVWGQSGYVGRHNATVDRMNEALERELESRGIPFVETNGRVEIGADNLHPSARGAQQIQSLIQQEIQGAQPAANVTSGPNPSAAMGG